MRVTTGTVVAGKIIVQGQPFADGSTVTVLAPENNEVFVLDTEDEAALLAAIAEADRGDVIEGEQFLRDLGSLV